MGNASNRPAAVSVSGDIAISNSGVTAIQALAVQTGMIADSAVTNDKISDGTIELEKLADVGAADGDVLVWDDSAAAWTTTASGAFGGSTDGITEVSRGTGIVNSGTSITSTGSIAVDIGTTANKVEGFKLIVF